MNKSRTYTGLDWFRWIAAILVIAIHTSPLSSLTETGDFIFTRIAARVAVPFFFMTSGFFLISDYSRGAERFISFIRKTLLIYGISIVVYVPVNIYNGCFSGEHWLPRLVKDLVFDGTMYHLWYLPASVTGAAIAWILVRKAGFGRAFIICLLLYAVGLAGDSYYGLTRLFPFLRGMYGSMFELFDYTRNGIFFAPVFFVLGGMAAHAPKPVSSRVCVAGFVLSAALMAAEGLALRAAGWQRHDSMYVFLVPAAYFLFHILLRWNGPSLERCRTSALVVYIIHPMVIIGVRLLAKRLGLTGLLVENSLVHFTAVSVLSILFSLYAGGISGRWKRSHHMSAGSVKDRAWMEINLNHVRHNLRELKQVLPSGSELMAVVKAKAYGHGAYEIAVCANRMGVRAFAVATIDEGICLRRYGIVGEILILGYTNPARAREIHKYDLTQTLIDYEYSLLLNKQGYDVKAHVKMDSGMHRLGFGLDEIRKIRHVFIMKHINVCGIYTHLCVADRRDEESVCYTRGQVERFRRLLIQLREEGDYNSRCACAEQLRALELSGIYM